MAVGHDTSDSVRVQTRSFELNPAPWWCSLQTAIYQRQSRGGDSAECMDTWGRVGASFPLSRACRGALPAFFSESSRTPRYRVTAAGFCLPLGFWRVLAFSAILSLVEGASSQLASSCRYQFETPYMYFFSNRCRAIKQSVSIFFIFCLVAIWCENMQA